MANVTSDVGSIAEALRELLRLVRDFIDPDKQDDRSENRRIKYLIRVRNYADQMSDIAAPYMDAQEKSGSELAKRYNKIKEKYDKYREKT